MFPFIWWLQGAAASTDDGPHEGGVDFLRRRAIMATLGEWNPSRLRPAAWYTADPEFITVSGADITAWRDRSGRGNHLVEAPLVNDPDLSATGWSSSKAAAVFTPPSNNLRTTGPVKSIGDQVTVFATIDLTSSASAKYLLQWTDEATAFFAIAFTGTDNFITPDINIGGNNIGHISAVGKRTVALILGGGRVSSYIDEAPDLVGDPIIAQVVDCAYLAMGVNALGLNGFNGAVRDVLIMPFQASWEDYRRYRAWARATFGGV